MSDNPRLSRRLTARLKSRDDLDTPTFESMNFPVKVLQFGGGVFLKAFVTSFIQKLNNQRLFRGRIALVQPLRSTSLKGSEELEAQEFVYSVTARGLRNGQPQSETQIVASIAESLHPYTHYSSILSHFASSDLELIFSNTTEKGLNYQGGEAHDAHPPQSYGARLTQGLYHRYIKLGAKAPHLYVIPCELVSDNGGVLKSLVARHAEEWKLPRDFSKWLLEQVSFVPTLVDRIVPGFPTDALTLMQKLGFEDSEAVSCELFHFWALGTKDCPELSRILPLAQGGVNAVMTSDIQAYETRKIRILNGLHSALSAWGLRRNFTTVLEVMRDAEASRFFEAILTQEILPTLDSSRAELEAYGFAVLERFRNPFLKHKLKDIVVNYEQKIDVRLKPTWDRYLASFGRPPPRLSLCLKEAQAYLKQSTQEPAPSPSAP